MKFYEELQILQNEDILLSINGKREVKLKALGFIKKNTSCGGSKHQYDS